MSGENQLLRRAWHSDEVGRRWMCNQKTQRKEKVCNPTWWWWMSMRWILWVQLQERLSQRQTVCMEERRLCKQDIEVTYRPNSPMFLKNHEKVGCRPLYLFKNSFQTNLHMLMIPRVGETAVLYGGNLEYQDQWWAKRSLSNSCDERRYYNP